MQKAAKETEISAARESERNGTQFLGLVKKKSSTVLSVNRW